MANTNVATRFDALRQKSIVTIVGAGIGASIRLPVYGLAASVIAAEESALVAGRVMDAGLQFANIGAAALEGAVRASNQALGLSGKTDAASFEADAELMAKKIYKACKGR